MGMEQPATGVSRRTILKGAATTLIVAAVTPGGLVVGHGEAWAAQAETLKPDSFATLVQMSRDIYPHPQLEDKIYAEAVAGLDKAAKDDAALKDMLENGVAELNKGGDYLKIEAEDARVALLKAMDTSAFFQKVRGNLITGIYNNKEVWPIFGYEGASASKGGYIHRGFNDISWL